jgi:hypothetical protein
MTCGTPRTKRVSHADGIVRLLPQADRWYSLALGKNIGGMRCDHVQGLRLSIPAAQVGKGLSDSRFWRRGDAGDDLGHGCSLGLGPFALGSGTGPSAVGFVGLSAAFSEGARPAADGQVIRRAGLPAGPGRHPELGTSAAAAVVGRCYPGDPQPQPS